MSQQQGLTLVELLVTLAILAILVGVAFPGFQGMIARNNLATSANAMLAAVSLARGEAVRQSGVTSLVAVNAGTATNEWGPGWQVLTTGAVVPLAPCARPACVRQFEAVPGALIFNAPANVSAIQFDSRGAVVGGPVVLELCNPGTAGVRVSITAIGRASTTDMTAAECP